MAAKHAVHPGQGRQEHVPEDRPTIGQLLRARRAHHGWTLADVSTRTKISKSALSKIENEAMSPTYQTILQICDGFEIEIADLFEPTDSGQSRVRSFTGRRVLNRIGDGQTLENSHYSYTYLCTEVAHKRIVPMIVEVRNTERTTVGELWSHVGEEFVYVLSGELVLQCDGYEPAHLATGDSAYLDSSMGHAFLSAGTAPAVLLVACSSATPNLAQTLREVLQVRFAGAGR